MNDSNLALNPFKKGKKTEVEGVRKVEVENDSLLQKVLEQYNSIEEGIDYDENIEYLSNLEEIILSPVKINLFLQEVILKDLIKGSVHYSSNITGFHITKLIQNSYEKGNNNFTLHTQDVLIDFLGYELEGKKNNPINITIQGNTGYLCGSNSTNLHFTIQGNTGKHCGENSTNSNFTIQGNTGDICGFNSTNSNFTIQGNTGDSCGRRSTNSTYKTPNKKIYEKLLKDVSGSNTIQLLGPNGEVLKEVKK